MRKVKEMSASEEPQNDAEREPNEDKGGQRLREPSDVVREVPLFLRDMNDGHKGDPQDEKDEVGE